MPTGIGLGISTDLWQWSWPGSGLIMHVLKPTSNGIRENIILITSFLFLYQVLAGIDKNAAPAANCIHSQAAFQSSSSRRTDKTLPEPT